MTDKFYVYTITSVESGEVLYVGKGSGYRWKTSLKRIEELRGSTCEVFIENVDSNDLALQKETKLIKSLAPLYNKRVSWRKIKEGTSGITKIAFKFPFVQQLVESRKVDGGFLYELVPIGIKLFKLMVTKVVDGAYTASFTLSTKRQNQLYVTTNATGVIEPSVQVSEDHRIIFDYFNIAYENVIKCLSILEVSTEIDIDLVKWAYLKYETDFSINSSVDIAMVLDYFACVCQSSRRVNSGVSRSKLISVGEILNFTFDPYTNGEENISGVRFVKYATDKAHKLYSLSMYRKDAQLKNAAEFGAKINKDVIKRVEKRLRIEGQLYPDAFLRFKKSVELKKLMDVSGNVDPKGGEAYFKSSKFLKHSDAGINELKQCLSMMADNLYLHLLFNAWSDVYVVKRLNALAGEDSFLLNMVSLWEKGAEIQPTRIYRSNPKLMEKVRKFNLRIKEDLGIDIREVPISVFTWIRKAIYESRFSEAEALEMAKLDMSGRNDARLKELRSVGITRSKELATNLRGVQLISWNTEYE
jgi:hypothetical protein